MTEYAPFWCACGGGTFYVSDDDQWTCRRCGDEWHGDIMRADQLVAPEMWVYRYVCTEVVNQTERYSPQAASGGPGQPPDGHGNHRAGSGVPSAVARGRGLLRTR